MADGMEEIRLRSMQQLAEAVDVEDDWTGLADSVARRKRQNRLNQRAYRRRRAEQAQKRISKPENVHHTPHPQPPFKHPAWNQPQGLILSSNFSSAPNLPVQSIQSSASVISGGCSAISTNPDLFRGNPSSGLGFLYQEASKPILIPSLFSYASPSEPPRPHTIIFPLSADHLLPLIQYNVLRATFTNMAILSLLGSLPHECGHALSSIQIIPAPSSIPPSLMPTALQQAVPHNFGIDPIPFPQMRDNMILNDGKFDYDDLCVDMLGGLFEGFNDLESKGVLVWSDPWSAAGWEVTEGFLKKWGFLLKGCGELIESSNRWREMRGEDRLVVEL